MTRLFIVCYFMIPAVSSFGMSTSGDSLVGHRPTWNIARFFDALNQKTQEITQKIQQRASWNINFLKLKNSAEDFIQNRNNKIRELKSKLDNHEDAVDQSSAASRQDIAAELAALLLAKGPIEEEDRIGPTASSSDLSLAPSAQTRSDFTRPPILQIPGQENTPGSAQLFPSTPVIEASQESGAVSLTPRMQWRKRARPWSDSVARDLNREHLIHPLLMELFSRFATQHSRHLIRIGDIGCGNAYLSRMIRERLRDLASRLEIKAVDLEEMLTIAHEQTQETPTISLVQDTASRLSLIEDQKLHLAVYNFVLQDCAHLDQCFDQLSRVLKVNGKAIITLPHPAFPGAYRHTTSEGTQTYTWQESYLTHHNQSIYRLLGQDYNPPIAVFSRPLSEYVNQFIRVGLTLEQFIEPRLSESQKQSLSRQELKELDTYTPISAVFVARKFKNPETGASHNSTPADNLIDTRILARLTLQLEKPSTPLTDLDPLEVPMILHRPEQSFSDTLQSVSQALASASKVILVAPHPCFPLAQHTQNANHQSVFSWSSDYHIRPLSLYFQEIREAGFELIKMLEINFPANYVIWIIRMQDPAPTQSPSEDFSSSNDPPSSLATVPDMSLREATFSSFPH